MVAKDFRAAARTNLAGSWGQVVLMTIVYAIMTSLGGIFYLFIDEDIAGIFSGIYTLLVGYIVIWSYGVSFYKKSAYGKKLAVENIFEGFHDYGRVMLMELLAFIFIGLWTLLFIIPGIVKSFSYAMAPYIMVDHPEMSASDAIKESKRMMDGHKWELFCLDFSYIGWLLVSIITCGIALLWVHPYSCAAEAEFYINLKNQNSANAQA